MILDENHIGSLNPVIFDENHIGSQLSEDLNSKIDFNSLVDVSFTRLRSVQSSEPPNRPERSRKYNRVAIELTAAAT